LIIAVHLLLPNFPLYLLTLYLPPHLKLRLRIKVTFITLNNPLIVGEELLLELEVLGKARTVLILKTPCLAR
jgi:hypothetical protein